MSIEELKIRLLKCGDMSQQELGRLASIERNRINRIFLGRTEPTASEVNRIAKALKVSESTVINYFTKKDEPVLETTRKD